MNDKRIHVVAAVIENELEQIFIAKRPEHVHQGGLWEFPGGKVEASESAEQALKRELFEELGIQIQKFEPLIQILHDYSDKSVFLDVWRVTQFDGTAHGKEGQQTRWINKKDLSNFDFPDANKPIITAATLPQHYLITPEPDFQHRDIFLKTIEQRLKGGIRLFQLRAKQLDSQQLEILYQEVEKICQPYNAIFLINSSIEFAMKVKAKGIHLSSTELLNSNNLPPNLICAASCHSEQEISKAIELKVDFIVISPVLKTKSHPESIPLSWERFKILCQYSTIPVFALGGMEREHLSKAIKSGAQGIAGIRSLWYNP